MSRVADESTKNFRSGPVPRDLLYMRLRWSCHPRTAHAYRWYVMAWLCWHWQRLWR